MKVLVVSSLFPLSVREFRYSFVFNEASKLSQRGITIHVARGITSVLNKRRDLIVEGMNIHNFSRRIDASIIPLAMKGAAALPLISIFHRKIITTTLLYSWFMTQLIKKHNPDLIHAHFAYPAGFTGLVAKRETETPLIVTLHGADILTDPSIGYGVRLDKRFDAIVKKVLREADVIIASSTATFKEALIAGCASKKLMLIPNGIDMKRFNPNINGHRIRNKLGINDKLMIFALRPHVPKNGIEYLIKAAHLVLKEKPNVIFVIGSDGPLRRRNEKLSKALGVSGNIFFTGYIPHEEVPFYYAASDIFVIPSVIEAFGLVTVEAMACGKPVIGSEVGGIPDVIRNGLNGYLVKPKDPRALADKLVFMLENPNLMKRMGKEGRRIAEKNFDIESRIDKILTVYSKLIE